MNYGLTKEVISSLSDTEYSNTRYYNFSGIDFYYKKYDNSKQLVVSFHGARFKINGIKIPLPIFRGYNWSRNMLCFSDKVLEEYPEIDLAWHCSPKTSSIQQTYIKIITFFIEKHYTNVIFHGSSGGGLPSLFYASYFHKKATLLNVQFYIYKYYESSVKQFLKYVQPDDLEVHNSEKIIEKYGLPSCAYIYINERDEHHYKKHYLPFKDYLIKKGFDSHFVLRSFIGEDPAENKTHHHIQLPPNVKLDNIFTEVFNSPSS